MNAKDILNRSLTSIKEKGISDRLSSLFRRKPQGNILPPEEAFDSENTRLYQSEIILPSGNKNTNKNNILG